MGIQSDEHGAIFRWVDPASPERKCYTVWSPFPSNSRYFGRDKQTFMLNYRVANLGGLLRALRKEGLKIVGNIEKYEYGKFGWIIDPEGNKVELWEPAHGSSRKKPKKKRPRAN